MARRRLSLNSNPMVRMGRGMAKTGRAMGQHPARSGGRRSSGCLTAPVEQHVIVEYRTERPFWQRHFMHIVVVLGIAFLLLLIATGQFR